MSNRVLVVSQQPIAANEITTRLETQGRRTVTALCEKDALISASNHTLDAVVIQAHRAELSSARALAEHLRTLIAPRRVPIACLVSPADAAADYHESFDAIIPEPFHAPHLSRRLNDLARMAVLQEEIELRSASLKRRGDGLSTGIEFHLSTEPYRVLFVGAAHPEFLAVQRAIRETGGNVTAAHTTFCAFDYLHDIDFDAVVLNAIEDLERTRTICAALRRNTRLAHTPTLLMFDESTDERAQNAVGDAASGVIHAHAGLDDMAQRINDLARQRRRQLALGAAIGQLRTFKSCDSRSGLANAHFFVEHVQAMAEHALAAHRPMSLVVLKAEAPRKVARAHRDAGLDQLGGMMRHLARQEDFSGRLSGATFAVAMPNAKAPDAASAAKRFCAVGECTAFENDDTGEPFQLTVKARAAELRTGESGRALVARALAEFTPQARAG